MMNTDTDVVGDAVVSASGQEMVDELARSGKLDVIFDAIDSGEVEMTGQGGFVPALIKAALERGLQAELSDHLGYEKGDPSAREHPNSRNGTSAKTVSSESGDISLDVPRDRQGSFDPKLVRKGQRRLSGLDDMIIPPRAALQRGRPQACTPGGCRSGRSSITWPPRSAPSCPTRRSATSRTR
jgi:hypothetical protein